MTIEIQMLEIEALIRERMASGEFRTIEDVLMQALRQATPSPQTVAPVRK